MAEVPIVAFRKHGFEIAIRKPTVHPRDTDAVIELHNILGGVLSLRRDVPVVLLKNRIQVFKKYLRNETNRVEQCLKTSTVPRVQFWTMI